MIVTLDDEDVPLDVEDILRLKMHLAVVPVATAGAVKDGSRTVVPERVTVGPETCDQVYLRSLNGNSGGLETDPFKETKTPAWML